MTKPNQTPKRTTNRRSPDGSKRGPVRTCVGCGSRRAQAELVRLHLDIDGHVRLDRTGAGRGAWLCAEAGDRCLSVAIERKALARAFRRKPDPASVQSLANSWPVSGSEPELSS